MKLYVIRVNVIAFKIVYFNIFIFIFYFRVSDSKKCAGAALNPIASRPKSTFKIPDAVYAPRAAILPQPHKTTHDLITTRSRSIVKGCVRWFFSPVSPRRNYHVHTQTSEIH